VKLLLDYLNLVSAGERRPSHPPLAEVYTASHKRLYWPWPRGPLAT